MVGKRRGDRLEFIREELGSTWWDESDSGWVGPRRTGAARRPDRGGLGASQEPSGASNPPSGNPPI